MCCAKNKHLSELLILGFAMIKCVAFLIQCSSSSRKFLLFKTHPSTGLTVKFKDIIFFFISAQIPPDNIESKFNVAVQSW